MTKLLEKAFEEASKLPETDQNMLARRWLADLEAEMKWDTLFAQSEDVLEQMARETLEADERGETEPLDPENL